MASCITSDWVSYSPNAKLTLTQSSSTGDSVTFSWKLEYITDTADPAYTNGQGRAYSVVIDGVTVKNGAYNINQVHGTHTVASGSTTVKKTKSSRNVSFSLSFNFDITWNGVYCGTRSASGSVGIGAKTSYTISYTANGGSGAPGNQTKWYGENLAISTTVPTRTGYTFKGWALSKASADSGNVYYTSGSTCGKNENLTLYAVWQIKSYSVTFVNGFGSTLKTQTVNYGSNATPPTNPTRTGHTFAGWSGSYTNVTSNRTITATWSINHYSLDLNGTLDGTHKSGLDTFGTADVYVNGSLISNDCSDFFQSFAYGSSYSIQDIKAKPGYTYIGNSSYSGTIGAGSVSVVLKFTTNQYNVTYNGNGGLYQGSSTWSEKVTYKSNYTTWSNDNFFVREGYTFKGWNESPYGTGVDWTSWIGKPWQYSYTNDVVLYAQWERNVYAVTFDANGGAIDSLDGGAIDSLKSEIPSEFVYEPEYDYYNVEISGDSVYSKDGETQFSGMPIWISANLKRNKKYLLELDFHPDAKILRNQIQIKENNDVFETELIQVDSLKWVVEINLPIDSSMIAIMPFIDWTSLHRICLFTYKLYEIQGKRTHVEKVTHGNLLSNVPTATRDNYLFLGWYTSKTDGVKLDPNIPITSDIIYYARWLLTGTIYIDNGTTFDKYQVYIDNGHSWDLYAPYVDDGLDWKILG